MLILIPAASHEAANLPSTRCRSWLEMANRTSSVKNWDEFLWSPKCLSWDWEGVGSSPARVIPKTRKMVFPCLALSIWTWTLVVTHTTRTIRAGVLVKTCGVCNTPIFSDKSKLYSQHPTKHKVEHGGQCAQVFSCGPFHHSVCLLSPIRESSTATPSPPTPFHLSHFNICHLFFFCAKFFGFLLYPRSINYLLSSCRSPGNSVIWAMAIFTIWLHEIDQ